MDKKENSFVENECISAIRTLVEKHPNDSVLGEEVRKFLNSLLNKDKPIRTKWQSKHNRDPETTITSNNYSKVDYSSMYD